MGSQQYSEGYIPQSLDCNDGYATYRGPALANYSSRTAAMPPFLPGSQGVQVSGDPTICPGQLCNGCSRFQGVEDQNTYSRELREGADMNPKCSKTSGRDVTTPGCHCLSQLGVIKCDHEGSYLCNQGSSGMFGSYKN